MRKPLVLASAASLLTIVIACGLAFKQEYAVPRSGLIDVSATMQGNYVVVTGGLLASGAKVTGTTVTVKRESALIRVSAEPLSDFDKPGKPSRTFRAVVPIAGITEISIGDDASWRTLGRIGSIRIAIPRLSADEHVNRVVWRRDAYPAARHQ